MARLAENMSAPIEQAGYSVRGLANWILDYSQAKGFTQTNMSINKLVFFAIEHVLGKRRRLLTKAKIEAWNHGPVIRELYQDFKKHGDEPITSRAETFKIETGKRERATISLAPQDEEDIVEALDGILELPSCILREISHASGAAWDRVWRYEGYANPGMEIKPELIIAAPTRRVSNEIR